MKNLGKSIAVLSLLLCIGGTINAQNRDMSNPFFSEYKTPFQVPPFNEIKLEHFKPAMEAGIVDQLAEIKAITDNKEVPNFDNTILAFDNSGELLGKTRIFSNLLSLPSQNRCQKFQSTK